MRYLAATGRPHAVALFGTGLIGSAVDEALRKTGRWHSVDKPYSWHDDLLRRDQLALIMAGLLGTLMLPASTASVRPRCDIVWAAGVSGFGSTPAEMQRELQLLVELCRASEELASRHLLIEVVFHLISSAGGLFEGKTQVDHRLVPTPLRPYGVGKVEQERIVQALRPRIKTLIYRPASVYGFRPGARRGLFATLIINALTNKPALISGAGRTLRDYVLARDIGRFVAGKVAEHAEDTASYFLASGKPTSMFEVIAAIEDLVRRPLYRRFESRASNALDLSFASSALPADFVSTPLRVGLAQLEADIRTYVIRRVRPWS